MNTASLTLDQAPPLAVPVSFFLLAPVALLAAGALLVLDAGALVGSRFHPAALAAAHLVTLGVLGAVMLGALYQMIPVVAGSPVPAPRLAHLVHLCLVTGLVALVWGFSTGAKEPFVVALWALGALLVLFIPPVGLALARAPTRSDTVQGMRLAVLGLLGVGGAGLVLANGRGGGGLSGDWTAWLSVHVALGVVAWIGGLITSVSWQVMPMFYLTPEPPAWVRRAVLVGVASALVLPASALAAGASHEGVLLCIAPGAVAVWLLHPLATAHALRNRKRRRKGISQDFWWAGLSVAPLALVAGVLAFALPDPRLPVLFGWLALFGWAGLIVHGMLTRILPFLVWFHRFSALVGLQDVPSMKRMLPHAWTRVGLVAHLAALALGVAAILSASALMVTLTGVAVAATGGALGAAMLRVLSFRPAEGAP